MQVAELIREAQADGLRLRVDSVGLVVEGDDDVRDRWREALPAAKPAIIAELAAADVPHANGSATRPRWCWSVSGRWMRDVPARPSIRQLRRAGRGQPGRALRAGAPSR